MSKFNNVGHTPLIPLRNLAGQPLVADVLIKDESTNPTGTHKDRKSAYLIERALEEGIDTLAILTAGNAGYSLATLAQDTGINVVTIVSSNIRPMIRKSLESAGACIVDVDFSQPLSSEDIVDLARTSVGQRVWDVTNEGHEAYQEIYKEIQEENADMVLCPIGSGELYMGLISALKEEGNRTIVYGAHPQRSQSIADKLCTEHLPLRNEILRKQMQMMFIESNSIGIGHGRGLITEEEIQWCVDNAPDFLNAEPSALVSLDMIHRLRDQHIKMIMINTGKGKVEE